MDSIEGATLSIIDMVRAELAIWRRDRLPEEAIRKYVLYPDSDSPISAFLSLEWLSRMADIHFRESGEVDIVVGDADSGLDAEAQYREVISKVDVQIALRDVIIFVLDGVWTRR